MMFLQTADIYRSKLVMFARTERERTIASTSHHKSQAVLHVAVWNKAWISNCHATLVPLCCVTTHYVAWVSTGTYRQIKLLQVRREEKCEVLLMATNLKEHSFSQSIFENSKKYTQSCFNLTFLNHPCGVFTKLRCRFFSLHLSCVWFYIQASVHRRTRKQTRRTAWFVTFLCILYKYTQIS